MPRMRVTLLALLAGAVAASPAAGLPGDPPITLVEPAADAVIPTGSGITVAYECPVYRQLDLGTGFVLFGGVSDHGAALATSPTLGPDGRLADVLTRDTAHQPPGLAAGRCQSGLGTGRADGPENTPGAYYWQVWRLCTGCTGSYETSEVRRLTVRADATLAVGAAGPAFAGFPVAVPVSAAGVPDGTTVTLERGAGSRVRVSGSGTARDGAAEVIATLPAGAQSLRARVRIGTDEVTSPPRTLRVRPAASPRVTAARDDGAWAGARGGTRLLVTGGGRLVRNLQTRVTMLCPQLPLPGGQGQVTTQVGVAAVSRARIAPDGRFIAAVTAKGASGLVRGTIRAGRLSGTARLSVGTCTGQATFTAARGR